MFAVLKAEEIGTGLTGRVRSAGQDGHGDLAAVVGAEFGVGCDGVAGAPAAAECG